MWIVNIKRKHNQPLMRYALKIFIHHLSILPLNIDFYINVGFAPDDEEQAASINFVDGVGDNIQVKNNQVCIDLSFLINMGEHLSLKYESDQPADTFNRVTYLSLPENIRNKMSKPFIDLKINEVKKKMMQVCSDHKIEISTSSPWEQKTIILSHDVDDLYGKSILRYIYWALKGKQKFSQTLKRIIWWTKQDDDPYFSPLHMCDIEGSFGFRSTFNFLCKTSYLTKDEGRRYNINSSRIKGLIRKIKGRGWEVGFHPSRETFNSPQKLAKEYSSLLKIAGQIHGVRRHYLKGTFPLVWTELKALNMEYDTTVGWPDHFGARAGSNRPFKLFNYQTGSEIDMYEIPLSFMDGTLTYLNDEQYINDYFEIENEMMQSGCMSFLWHTDRLCDEIFNPKWKYIYLKILESWHKKNYKVSTNKEFIDNYKEHEARFEIKFNEL